MSYVTTETKTVQFLLACLLYKAYRDTRDDLTDNELPRLWEIPYQGPEAHYLKLLYGTTLDADSMRVLFKQGMIQTKDDFTWKWTLFDCLSYAKPDPDNPDNGFDLTLSLWFYRQLKGFNNLDEIDRVLGWPKNFAKAFFPYMYDKPLAESTEDLGKAIGFSDLMIPNKPINASFSLDKVPIECPHCHSKHTVEILVGMLAVEPDPERYYVYGCCTEGLVPDWYCKDCYSFIYLKNSKWRFLSRQ